MLEELCGAVDPRTMMRHLEEFARRVKLSGTPEELESFEYLRRQVEAYGLRTELILHDAYISLPGPARLTLTGSAAGDAPGDGAGGTPDCITHSFSRASGPAGVRARVVYAGQGTPADFAGIDAAGRVVLLDGIANPAASLRASRAGAVGQIHVSPLPHLYEMCISPVWGSPTPEQRDLLPTTVVVTVRRADGEALRARVLGGEAVEAELLAEVDTGWRRTPILEAHLDAGDARDDGFVLFSGHHDTWHRGVMDNGSANATMLEVARLLAPRRAALRRGLRLCFWSGHSHGRYSGSSWYADAKFMELAGRCVAHVNVDSVGARGNTVLADALSSNELFALAAEAVGRWGGQRLDGHRMSRAGDQSFWGIGVPSLFMALGEQPAGEGDNVMGPAIGGARRKGAGFGWWWHTPDDTLDKIDPDLLVRDARIYVHAIGRLLTDPVLPLDVGRQAESMGRELSALAEALGGRLDVTGLLTGVRALVAASARLREKAAGASDLDAAPLNRALVAACRALVPIDYTSGDRFDPDPALRQNAYPVLDPVRALAATPAGSEDALFAAVAARRAVNRVAVALAEAQAALAACA